MDKIIAFLNDNPFMIVVVVLIITMIAMLIYSLCRRKPSPQPPPPIPIDIPSIVNAIRIKTKTKFLSDSEIMSVGQSILRIYSQNDDKKWSAGQCFVYAHKDNVTYIGLPKHCYNPKNSRITLKDHTGTIYEYSWKGIRFLENFDAAMMPVFNSPFLHLPSLCEQGLIKNSEQIISNSIFCVTPFNVRGMKVKSGKIVSRESALYDFFCSEGGDSGSLIIGKYGVIGMHVSSCKDQPRRTFFIDMQKMEDLYMAFTS